MLKSLGTFFLDVLEVVVFAIGIFFFVYLLILRPHKIKGQSMQPNFPDAEYLLTEKVTYYLRKPVRGDVIVFSPPVSEDDEYIKRVIALPGETVRVQEGKVYVNGELLKEEYLDDSVYTFDEGFLGEGVDFLVPEGKYFVMGDNREHSSDSRAFGPIAFNKISGRAWVVYWPPQESGVVKLPSFNL